MHQLPAATTQDELLKLIEQLNCDAQVSGILVQLPLPKQIEDLEEEQEKLLTLFSDLTFYQRDPKEVAQNQARAEVVADLLLKGYERWEYLEASLESSS